MCGPILIRIPVLKVYSLCIREHIIETADDGKVVTSNSPSKMAAKNVVSASASAGSSKSFFIAAKALQYCSLALDASCGV